MSNNPIDNSDERPIEKYVLKLYVAAKTLLSMRAITNIKEICEQYLDGQYELEIIDIFNRPSLSRRHGIVATPLLIKQHPLPTRQFIGDMTNTDKILNGLGISRSRDTVNIFPKDKQMS